MNASLLPTAADGLAWAQTKVAAHHYLHKAVDRRCRPFAYIVQFHRILVGCLIFGRPQSTCCFQGGLTYGGRADVAAGRAAFDRWEVLSLARVWLAPEVQTGGALCRQNELPGFVDRRGIWRPALASWAIREALRQINYDYLYAYPPCFLDEPYEIKAVLSYCDTRLHRGTIYRAAAFELARRNGEGIETWWTDLVTPLHANQDRTIRARSADDDRAARIRAARSATLWEVTA